MRPVSSRCRSALPSSGSAAPQRERRRRRPPVVPGDPRVALNAPRLVIVLDDDPRCDVVPRSGGGAEPAATIERRRGPPRSDAVRQPGRGAVVAGAVAVRASCAGMIGVDGIVDGVAGALARTHDAPVYASTSPQPGQPSRRDGRRRAPTVAAGRRPHPPARARWPTPPRVHRDHDVLAVAPPRQDARPVLLGQVDRAARPPATPANAAASAAERARPASTTSPASAPIASTSTTAITTKPAANGTACPRSPRIRAARARSHLLVPSRAARPSQRRAVPSRRGAGDVSRRRWTGSARPRRRSGRRRGSSP